MKPLAMKPLKVFCLSVLISCFLFSCTGGRASRDMVRYVNQDIINISQLEILALQHYAAATGENYTTAQNLQLALQKDVIPYYKRFYELLGKITPTDPKLKKVHLIYLRGAEEIYEGFNAKRIGLEKNDEGLIRLANRRIESGGKIVAQWQLELYRLVTENRSVSVAESE